VTGGVVGKAQLFCAGDDNGRASNIAGVAVPQDEVGGADASAVGRTNDIYELMASGELQSVNIAAAGVCR